MATLIKSSKAPSPSRAGPGMGNMRPFSIQLPPLQGEGRGGDGVNKVVTSSHPIPLLTSPLKGEEYYLYPLT